MSALDAVLFVAADNDVTKRAARELAALRAELKQTQSDRQREHELRCQLAGEVEALRADAERYRFLRDRAGNAIMQQLMADCVPSGWNTKVDAALAAEAKK